ncbi:MAG: hypothetical protein ACTSYM_00070 [Candidatus Baldrarchaeia archaeon]
MGTFHFATLGYSPGVVTCPLYIVSKYRSVELPGGVQKVLIFTPKEIAEKRVEEYVKTRREVHFFIKNNDVTKHYLHLTFPEVVVKVSEKYVHVKDGVETVILPDKVNVNKMLEIFARYFAKHRRHNVWVNPAGGTLPMSIALMFAAQLGAMAGRIYYTYARPGSEKYLIPPDNWTDYFELTMLPVFPTFLHKEYILTLKCVNRPMSEEEILACLKSKGISGINRQRIRRMLLRLKNYKYIENVNDKVVISSRGQEVLDVLQKIIDYLFSG